MDKEPNLSDNYGLQELGGSDFEIADHEPDIRGWTIKDVQGRTIGEVDELIFDPQTRKVRYIVMDLEGNVLDLEPRDVLVPIGLAELHESDDDVILPTISADQLRALPLYEKGRITREVESSVRSVFAGAGAAASAAGSAIANAADRVGDAVTPDRDRERFYEHEHFDEKKFYRNRPSSLTRDVRIMEKKNLPPSTGTPTTAPKTDSTTMGGTTAGTGTGTTAGSTSAGTGTTTGTGTGAGSSTGTSGAMGTGTAGTGTAGAGTSGGTTTSGASGSGTSGTGSSGMGTPGTGMGTSGTGTTGAGTTGTGSTGTGTGSGGTGAGTSTGTPGTSSGTPPGRTSTDENEKPHIET